jgi:hypothetical protein
MPLPHIEAVSIDIISLLAISRCRGCQLPGAARPALPPPPLPALPIR